MPPRIVVKIELWAGPFDGEAVVMEVYSDYSDAPMVWKKSLGNKMYVYTLNINPFGPTEYIHTQTIPME